MIGSFGPRISAFLREKGGLQVKRILFVDDEPKLLEGMKRMLYPFRKDWEMVFLTNPLEALELLASREFDVLISDLRMPQLNGIELLSQVRDLRPEIVRIILSGQAEKSMTLSSLSVTHQYLAKPCDAATLRSTVERALRLRVTLKSPALKRIIGGIQSLPSIPSVYTRLVQAIESPDVSPSDIAAIITQDLAMTAKVLQLVNSALFGLNRRITSVSDAVLYVGTETIRALVLSLSVFSQFDTQRCPSFSPERIRDHGLATASLARQIGKSLGLAKQELEDVYLAALLHELGKLVLAANCPDEYEAVLRRASTENAALTDAEQEVFGAGHAQVGAYLLWLWGLPDVITEAVAYYVEPGSETTLLGIAIHVASALSGGPKLNYDCLSERDLLRRLPEWEHIRDLQMEVAA